MRVLSDATALGWPSYAHDLEATVNAVAEARRGIRAVEVRIGIGRLTGVLPARIFGYALCVADVLQSDVPALARHADRIVIFSSAPKTGCLNFGLAARSLVMLAAAFRLAGVSHPITIELAATTQEVSSSYRPELPPSLGAWIEARASHHTGAPDYAFEHAAASMFGDLTTEKTSPFCITVGGRTEAPFWAVRMRVRALAMRDGLHVVPAAALILKALRVPWYHPVNGEPPIEDLMYPLETSAKLERMANPGFGGNPGLAREARAMRRLAHHSHLPTFIEGYRAVKSTSELVQNSGFSVGPRLENSIRCGMVDT